MPDLKITQLTEETSPSTSDVLPLVVDTLATPVTKKVTIANLLALGGGGGLILIEKKLITSAQTTVTFSGLDGDTDEVYLMTGRVVIPSGGSSPHISWQPNGITTNQTAQRLYANFTTPAADGFGNLAIFNGTTVGTVATFAMVIHAKKNPNGVAADRQYFAIGSMRNGGGPVDGVFVMSGHWAETATNITSIVINSSVASKIGDGSTFALYKFEQ